MVPRCVLILFPSLGTRMWLFKSQKSYDSRVPSSTQKPHNQISLWVSNATLYNRIRAECYQAALKQKDQEIGLEKSLNNLQIYIQIQKLNNQPKKSLFLKAFYIKHWFLRMKIDVLLKKNHIKQTNKKSSGFFLFSFLFLVLPVYYYNPSSSTLTHVCSVMKPHGLQPAKAPLSMDCFNKNTGVGCQLS